MVKELTNFKHVPALKKNPLSLSVFKEIGYKIVLEEDEAKVYNGLLVLIKGILLNMLYYLVDLGY